MAMPSPDTSKTRRIRIPLLCIGVGALLAIGIVWRPGPRPEATTSLAAGLNRADDEDPSARAAPSVLADRIAAALARANEPIRIEVPLLDPFGTSLDVGFTAELAASNSERAFGGLRAEVLPGSLVLHAPRQQPVFPVVRLTAAGFAPRLLRALPLGGADMTADAIRFSPGATLRGRAFGPGDQPLAARRVVLWDVNGSEIDRLAGRTLPLDATTTDAEGFFTFRHCASRLVRCELEVGDGLATAILADAIAGAGPVRLDSRTADPPIRGQVMTPAGEPIPGARVVASMTGPRERGASRVVADGDGRFSLDHLVRGYYAVTVEAEGRLPVMIRRVHSGTGGIAVMLEPAASAELELLGAPAAIEIPILWRLLDGVDPGRRPTTPFAFATLRDGHAVLTGIPPGRHAIELRVPGAAPLATAALAYDAGRTTVIGLLQLTAGATIVARVADASGRPVAGRAALAAAFQAGHVVDRDVFALAEHEVLAFAADGKLRWESLPSGRRTLAVRAPGCADRVQGIDLVDGTVLDLGTIGLMESGALEGVVRHLSGVPLGDATIVAERVGGPRLESISLADGSFRFERLPPGRFEVRLLASDDETTYLLDGAMPAAEPSPVLLDVEPGATIRRDLSLGR
jgi:hypothetical protein